MAPTGPIFSIRTNPASAAIHVRFMAPTTNIGNVMLEPGTPPATRVRAADSILDHTTKAIEIESLEARLIELERAAGCRYAGQLSSKSLGRATQVAHDH